ncbi:MAG: hypothetical protein [Wendovervirus sonii]|uniref:Uncharacterized protein n=1 Tax=phage Lak_Megaphage_Sonny TaxID=3109229 RepID=A0ABZ0Z3E6_9CAUD|nr:MAG: hypothetical protein [phage Lak_Megaphage_Sonny]
MKNEHLFITHFCNNMHADLFEQLTNVQIFKNNMAFFEFVASNNTKLVMPSLSEPMRSVLSLSDDEIKNNFDVILNNDAQSDIEIIVLNKEGQAIKKVLLEEPEFIMEGIQNFDYDYKDPKVNTFTYLAKYKSITEKEI